MKKIFGKVILALTVFAMVLGSTACSNKSDEPEQIVIYSNADDEAIADITNTLNENGFKDKFVISPLATSELGGKLLAEGKDIEANMITMSTYFIDSAQKKNDMFMDFSTDLKPLEGKSTYYQPILGNTGSIFVNTEVMKKNNLPMPTSIKDLTKPEFKDKVSIPNIMNSSTAWLLTQAIISEYGENEGKQILKDLVANCGPHVEKSGSGPIKKVRSGEVAVGFGLRHQAIADMKEGKPILSIDPTEGNFTLTEGVAVVKKENSATNELAAKMAKVIVEKGREKLIKNYPVALYQGETVSDEYKPKYSKKFNEALTVDLLKKHQDFYNSISK